jgi:hypothetical protein
LIGAQGISPVAPYLQSVREQIGLRAVWYIPSLAWLNASDGFLLFLCWAGAAFALALIFRVTPVVSLAALWALYLSVVAAGQDFLSFQWDALLLEVGFAAILLAPWGLRPSYRRPPSAISVWVLRLILFRLMFESGIVKLRSGDPNWRNLTALSFHYETQPLPTVFAWYAHQLPLLFQKASVVGVFVVELAVPFLFLAPRRFRMAGAWITIALQLLIATTGNYAFFNLLTILLCVALLDDGRSEPSKASYLSWAVGIVLIAAGVLQVLTMAAGDSSLPAPIAWLGEKVEEARVVNHYGLFAVMTTSRPEIVIEGSDDSENWKAYEFKFKPGDVMRAPRWVAPHQPRLDWQMWFAALSSAQQMPWFSGLMLRVLQGSPAVVPLFRHNPFPDQPPKFVRAVVYDYHFTSPEERRLTGAWWTRRYAGIYFPVVSVR